MPEGEKFPLISFNFTSASLTPAVWWVYNLFILFLSSSALAPLCGIRSLGHAHTRDLPGSGKRDTPDGPLHLWTYSYYL